MPGSPPVEASSPCIDSKKKRKIQKKMRTKVLSHASNRYSAVPVSPTSRPVAGAEKRGGLVWEYIHEGKNRN